MLEMITPVLLRQDGTSETLTGEMTSGGAMTFTIPAGEQRIHFSVPVRDMAGYWHPGKPRPQMKVDWHILFTAGAQQFFPYFTLFSDGHRNRFSVGLTEFAAESDFASHMNQFTGTLEIEFVLNAPREFQLFMDLRDIPWVECLEEYRKMAHPAALPEYPASVWDPVFCTWYAFHADLHQDEVEENARLAAELGFKTFILDDGWCYDNPQRLRPGVVDWFKDIGSWKVSEKKFPDMKGHVKRVRDMGMNYLVWTGPTMVGMCSPEFKKLKLTTPCPYERSFWHLDTRDEASVQDVLDRLENLVREYGLSGLKVDFIDDEKADRKSGMSDPTYRFLKRLQKTLQNVVPDAMIEFRQSYISPLTVDLATQFRAGDAPFDFVDNFNRIAQIRVIAGDQVPIHADPVFWARSEKPENIARHLVASLAAVPMASMDLRVMTEVEKKIFLHYIGFYKAHQDVYRLGHWNVQFRGGMASVISGKYGDCSIVIAADPADAMQIAAAGEAGVNLLNLSPEELPAAKAKAVYDGCGNKLNSAVIPVGGRAEF